MSDTLRSVPSQRPSVLVVEDAAPIRSALEIALKSENYEVTALLDASSLVRVTDESRPHLAVLDVRLRIGPDGYAMARVLRSRSTLPSLFLTAADAVEDRIAGFEVGADDYLIKPFSMAELLVRVQALLRRSGRLVSTPGRPATRHRRRRPYRRARGSSFELSRTEYDLLAMLAQNVGRVLSKTQPLTQVWGFDGYDSNLVEVHMSALRRKLKAAGPRLIRTVRGAGYVLRE